MAENPNAGNADKGNNPADTPFSDDIKKAAHDADAAADKLVERAADALHSAEDAVVGAGEAAVDAGARLVDNAGNVINHAGATAAGIGIAAKKSGAQAIDKAGHAVDETTIAAQRAARKAARDAKALADRVADRADNIKWLVIALLVLLIAAAGIYSYVTKTSAKRAADAQNAVFKSALEMQGKPEADALAVFGKSAQDFKGLPAGQQARLYQFAYAFNTGKYADSEQAARDFLKEYPNSAMANRASLALGQAQVQQGNLDDAISSFRALVTKNDPETFAEAKLALAQALSLSAEKVKEQPEEYRRRLELAEQEYSDIISRANISIPSQRGYWPQSVTLPADYALVQIKDKLAGHTHGAPSSIEAEAPVSQRDLEGAGAIRPPSANGQSRRDDGQSLGITSEFDSSNTSGVAATFASAAAAIGDGTVDAKDAVGDALKSGADAAQSGVEAIVDAAKAGADSLANRASKAVDALRGYAVNAASTGSDNHIPRVVNLVNGMHVDEQGTAAPVPAVPSPSRLEVEVDVQAQGSPDGVIDVQTDVDHADEEYVKASEAGM